MNRFRMLCFLFLAMLALPVASLGQTINSNPVPNANFNSTTPTADLGFNACTFKTSSVNVITECPSGAGVVNSIAYSTTPVIALSLGSVQQFTCTTAGAAIVPTITGISAGKTFTVIFVQNGTTACTFAFPSTIHGATAVSATLSSISVQKFVVSANGTDAYAEAAGTSATGGTP